MKGFLWILSVYLISMGAIIVFLPAFMKTFCDSVRKYMKPMCVAAIVIGVLILWAASASSWEWLIRIIGIISILKGLAGLFITPKVLDSAMNWWLSQKPIVFKIHGIVVGIIGLIVNWSII